MTKNTHHSSAVLSTDLSFVHSGFDLSRLARARAQVSATKGLWYGDIGGSRKRLRAVKPIEMILRSMSSYVLRPFSQNNNNHD